MKKHYRQHDEEAVLYSDEYVQHVSAMTAEKLHGKSEIAEELAFRDLQIKQLTAQVAELEKGDDKHG